MIVELDEQGQASDLAQDRASYDGRPVQGEDEDESDQTLPYSARALQGWLLVCCQVTDGGLRDKPGKHN